MSFVLLRCYTTSRSSTFIACVWVLTSIETEITPKAILIFFFFQFFVFFCLHFVIKRRPPPKKRRGHNIITFSVSNSVSPPPPFAPVFILRRLKMMEERERWELNGCLSVERPFVFSLTFNVSHC